MKNILTLVVVAIFLSVICLIIYIQVFAARIKFSFDITGLSFKQFNLQSLLNQGQEAFSVAVKSTVQNGNGFTINIKNPYIQVLYNGQVIAYSGNDYIQKVKILPNASTSFTEHLIVVVNANTVSLISALTANQKVKLEYKVKINIFGMYFLISDTYSV